LGGRYDVDVDLTAPTSPVVYDRRERAGSFVVVDERGREGLVDLGGRWSSISREAVIRAS
jgi:hypothetical protein